MKNGTHLSRARAIGDLSSSAMLAVGRFTELARQTLELIWHSQGYRRELEELNARYQNAHRASSETPTLENLDSRPVRAAILRKKAGSDPLLNAALSRSGGGSSSSARQRRPSSSSRPATPSREVDVGQEVLAAQEEADVFLSAIGADVPLIPDIPGSYRRAAPFLLPRGFRLVFFPELASVYDRLPVHLDDVRFLDMVPPACWAFVEAFSRIGQKDRRISQDQLIGLASGRKTRVTVSYDTVMNFLAPEISAGLRIRAGDMRLLRAGEWAYLANMSRWSDRWPDLLGNDGFEWVHSQLGPERALALGGDVANGHIRHRKLPAKCAAEGFSVAARFVVCHS